MDFICPLKPKPSWCCEQCKQDTDNDPQKIRLYCFEETLAAFKNDYKLLSLAECKQIAVEICSFYGVPEPEIKDGRGLKTARGGFNPDMKLRIKLPRQYRFRVAVLHEAAHCIFQYLTQNEVGLHQPHDPTYIQYLLDIYAKCLNLPLSHLQHVAAKFQLGFKSSTECPNAHVK